MESKKIRIKTDISNLKEIFESLILEKEAPKLSISVDLEIKDIPENIEYLNVNPNIEKWEYIEDKSIFLERLIDWKNVVEILNISKKVYDFIIGENNKPDLSDIKILQNLKIIEPEKQIFPEELVIYIVKILSRGEFNCYSWRENIKKIDMNNCETFQDFIIGCIC